MWVMRSQTWMLGTKLALLKSGSALFKQNYVYRHFASMYVYVCLVPEEGEEAEEGVRSWRQSLVVSCHVDTRNQT